MKEEQKIDQNEETKEDIKEEKSEKLEFGQNQDIINEDYKDSYLRALADYQNLLRQSQKDKEDFFRYALNDFLQDILPIYDNLKMSIASLSEVEEKSSWVQGVRHVLKQFKEVLENKGVEEIKTVGEEFNHDSMEALGGEGDLVDKEIKSGYKLNGRVIIPAKVIVKNK